MPSSSNRRRPCRFCPTILITTVLAATTATADLWSSDQGKEPRSFNLRDPDHSDAVSAVALGLLQHYPPLSGPASMVDDTKQYFRLLELDGNHLLVGAADAVHNISLQSFERVSIYRWAPEEAEHRECTMKSMDQELCRNFVRVLSRLSGGRLLMCGTNAFAPKCRLLSPRGDIVSEFGAVGLAPFDPAQNSSYVLAQGDDLLYSATVADFAGTDALIFRRNVSEPVEASDRALLRTQRGNPLMLDRPQFVGTLQTEEHVYFFFHEEAAEASAEFRPAAYSRVARVCKSDRGVPRRVAAAEWSTFVKARLNCSVPERNRPFYFDELVSISSSSSVGNDGTGGEDALIYATFVSEFNFLRHSVICAFRLRHVDELFRNGHYLAYDAVQRKWTRRERDDLTAGLGQCPRQGQKVMSDEEAIAVRKFTLMADALPNAFPGGAVGIHRGADHYSQIAVLPAVPHMDGGFVDVLYVATDHGNVLKMVNLITNMSGTSDHPPAGGTPDRRPHRSRAAAAAAVDDPLRLITVLRLSRQPIRRLLVSAPRFLVVVTDQRVHRVQLQLCELYPTCTLCVAARDPHCAWHHARCRSWQQIKSFDGEQPVQDVLGRKAPEELCRGKETASTPPPSPSTKKVAMATVATAGDEPRGAIEKSTNRTTKKGANSSSNRKACECPLFSAHKCECPEAEFLLDGMSPPAGGRPPAAPPTQWPTSTDMESITEGQALPWWVLLLLAIAVLQTIAFVWLCCRLHARRRRQRNAMSSSGKVPLGSTDSGGAVLNTCSAPISAYSAASILINAKQSRTPAGPSIVEQYQQHNNNNNNSSTTTSGQWTLTSGSGSAASPSVSSNRSSTASSPVVGAFAIAGGMGPGLPRTAAMARRASFTGGGYARRSNYADGEISIRLDGVSACGTAMTLPPPSAAPVPPHHLAQLYHQQQLQQRLHSQWPPAMSTFRR